MATFGSRLKELRISKGITQQELSDSLSVSKQAISQYERGLRIPKSYDDIADYFNVDLDYLTGRSDKTTIILHPDHDAPKHKGVKIPVLGHVAAGTPIEEIEDIIDTEEITQEMAKTGEFFGLKIKGDSMSPRICNGDVVIVRKQSDAESDQIVIAQINGDEATCKRLLKYDNAISLVPLNPAYEPKVYTKEQVEKLPVEIIGRVVENRQKY